MRCAADFKDVKVALCRVRFVERPLHVIQDEIKEVHSKKKCQMLLSERRQKMA